METEFINYEDLKGRKMKLSGYPNREFEVYAFIQAPVNLDRLDEFKDAYLKNNTDWGKSIVSFKNDQLLNCVVFKNDSKDQYPFLFEELSRFKHENGL